MTQLIINGSIVLPQTSHEKYKCYPSKLAEQLEMISGRTVEEERGNVQIIEYSYDYLSDDVYLPLLAALRASPPIVATYLPDDSETMVTGNFIVTSFPPPAFAFAAGSKALWHNTAFTLREVKPHD